MSRLYRALREVNPTIPELAEKPADGPASAVESRIDREFPGLAAPQNNARTEDDRGEGSAAGASASKDASPTNGWLGVIAKGALDRTAPLIPNTIDLAVIESYRRLRAKIIQEQERNPFRSLVITSPAPEDGKTVTALNLALSLAAVPSYRVLLVDGDLRRGRLGKALGVGELPGLGNLIEGTAELEDVVLRCDNNPGYFMLRGSSATPPAELLYSSRLVPQLRKMAEHFSLVLIDSPPVNLVSDAQLLAAGCDAVLVVARAFATTRKGLQKAVQELSPFRIIGTVLNRGIRTDLTGYYKYY